MKELFETFNYIADPHGAVGFLGLKEYQKREPQPLGIFLETAHPIKFLDVVRETLGKDVEIPPQIAKVMLKEKVSTSISSYQELKDYLLTP